MPDLTAGGRSLQLLLVDHRTSKFASCKLFKTGERVPTAQYSAQPSTGASHLCHAYTQKEFVIYWKVHCLTNNQRCTSKTNKHDFKQIVEFGIAVHYANLIWNAIVISFVKVEKRPVPSGICQTDLSFQPSG